MSVWKEISLSEDGPEGATGWIHYGSAALPGLITKMKFSPCQTILATQISGELDRLTLWELAEDTAIRKFSFPLEQPGPVLFRWISAAGENSLLLLRDFASVGLWRFRSSAAELVPEIVYEFIVGPDAVIMDGSLNDHDLTYFSFKDLYSVQRPVKSMRASFCETTEVIESQVKVDPSLVDPASRIESLLLLRQEQPDEPRVLIRAAEAINLATTDKSMSSLGLLKAWPVSTPLVNIVGYAAGRVLFLDKERKLCLAVTSNLKSARTISVGPFTSASVISAGSDEWRVCGLIQGRLFFFNWQQENDILCKSFQPEMPIRSVKALAGFTICRGQDAFTVISDDLDDAMSVPIRNRDDVLDCVPLDQGNCIVFEQSGGTELQAYGYERDSSFTLIYSLRDALWLQSGARRAFGPLSFLYVYNDVLFGSSLDCLSGECSVRPCGRLCGQLVDIQPINLPSELFGFACLDTAMLHILVGRFTSRGVYEVVLTKSSPLPPEVDLRDKAELLPTAGGNLLLKCLSNLFRVDLDAALKESDHSTSGLQPTAEELIIALIQGNLNSLLEECKTYAGMASCGPPEFRDAFIRAAEVVSPHLKSIDEFGLRAIFLQSFRHQIKAHRDYQQFEARFLGYELLCSARSDSQQILVDECVRMSGGTLDFDHFCFFKMAFWIKNDELLKSVLEKLARAEFARGNNYDLATFLYVLMEKPKAAAVIWKNAGAPEAARLYEFLSSDFGKEQNLSKAEKNAYALIGKQRFIMAAAFFLVSRKINDAFQLSKRLSVDFRALLTRFLSLSEPVCVGGVKLEIGENGAFKLETATAGPSLNMAFDLRKGSSGDASELLRAYSTFLREERSYVLTHLAFQSNAHACLPRLAVTVFEDHLASVVTLV